MVNTSNLKPTKVGPNGFNITPTSLRSAGRLRKDSTGRYVQRKGSQSSSTTSTSNNGKIYISRNFFFSHSLMHIQIILHRLSIISIR